MKARLAIHITATLLFVGVLVMNHKMALNLSVTELTILAAVLGVHQVTAIVKALKAPPAAEKPDA